MSCPNGPQAPVLVGPHNAVAVLGLPWRRAREQARALGLRPMRVGRTYLYPVAELVEAFGRGRGAAPDPTTEPDPAEAARQALGKMRRRAE